MSQMLPVTVIKTPNTTVLIAIQKKEDQELHKFPENSTRLYSFCKLNINNNFNKTFCAFG